MANKAPTWVAPTLVNLGPFGGRLKLGPTGPIYGLNATLTPCIFAPTPDQVMHVMAQGQHELGPSRPLLSSPILWVRAVLVAKRLQFFLPTEGSQPEGRLEHVGPRPQMGSVYHFFLKVKILAK